MTITFENDNDVIVYALEKIIAYARQSQQIFVAQCVWWLASIIGLEPGLVTYIDNLRTRVRIAIAPENTPVPTQEEQAENDPCRQDRILRECEEYLQDSKRLRNLAKLKPTGITKTGRINPSKATNVTLRKGKATKDYSRTEGIGLGEIARRKSAGECLRCAWPPERKGNHQVKDCIRPIKKDIGTAEYSKASRYRKVPPITDSDEEE
jgi:hypothetical protein